MKVVLTADTHDNYNDRTSDLLDAFWLRVAKEHPDLLIHAGDWGMTMPDLDAAMEGMREWVKCPVLGVLGNHDWWGSIEPGNVMTMQARMIWYQSVFRRYDVIWGGGYESDGVNFYAFDGWYLELYPPTNDRRFVPPAVWDMLDFQRTRDANRIFVHEPDVLVTHFPISTGEMKAFSQFGHYLMLGHWHEPIRAKWFDVEVVNPGSNYNAPQFVTINL